MATSADLQILTQPGSTGNQTISLPANFDPRAVYAFATARAADGIAAHPSIGWGVGTYRGGTVEQRYTALHMVDTAASMDSAKDSGNDALLVLLADTANTTSRGLKLDLVSMQTGATSQIVINWANLHATASIRVALLILGGADITDAIAGHFTIGTGANFQDVAMPSGFGKPEGLIVFGSGTHNNGATPNVSPMFFVGFAKQGEPGRGFAYSNVDGNTASLNAMAQRSDRLIIDLLTTAASAATERSIGRLDPVVSNWATDSFRILWSSLANTTGVNPTGADVVNYLALRGTFSLKTGNGAAPTSGTPPVNQDIWSGTSSAGWMGVGTAATAASGNVTPAYPTSPAPTAGNLCILQVESGDNVAHSVTGWTQVYQQNQGTILRASVWTRVFQAGDTAPTVTHTGGDSIKAQIHCIGGINTATANGVNASSVNAGTGGTVTLNGVTPTAAGSLIVALISGASSDTSGADAIGAISGSDPALAERADSAVVAGVRTVVGAMAEGIKGTAAATGNRTATYSGAGVPGSEQWIAIMLALTPTTATAGTPRAAIVFGWNNVPATALQTALSDQVGFSFGLTDGTDQYAGGFTDDDAAGTMVQKRWQETDHVIANYATPATPALASSATGAFSGDALRLGWDDTDTVGREWQVWIIGDAPSGGAGSVTAPISSLALQSALYALAAQGGAVAALSALSLASSPQALQGKGGATFPIAAQSLQAAQQSPAILTGASPSIAQLALASSPQAASGVGGGGGALSALALVSSSQALTALGVFLAQIAALSRTDAIQAASGIGGGIGTIARLESTIAQQTLTAQGGASGILAALTLISSPQSLGAIGGATFPLSALTFGSSQQSLTGTGGALATIAAASLLGNAIPLTAIGGAVAPLSALVVQAIQYPPSFEGGITAAIASLALLANQRPLSGITSGIAALSALSLTHDARPLQGIAGSAATIATLILLSSPQATDVAVGSGASIAAQAVLSSPLGVAGVGAAIVPLASLIVASSPSPLQGIAGAVAPLGGLTFAAIILPVSPRVDATGEIAALILQSSPLGMSGIAGASATIATLTFTLGGFPVMVLGRIYRGGRGRIAPSLGGGGAIVGIDGGGRIIRLSGGRIIR